MIKNKYIEGDYEIIEYENGAIVKTLITNTENTQIIPQKQITIEELNAKIDDLTLLILAQQGVIEQ
ncbi:hypothetical protein ABG79_02197 [Caloramator mitchellensis]|uniref:Uncharacterized protein n=1 Tax=Caloramator mitchellensis TaxID=908809 RepID=A0A0R3JRH3_CALMK|nr:hypothetical protein [Caloramator mitchellensis]KRQ86065.1 hypothetical protein ABG79_02197 [Caloramator mitchellensis]